MSETESKARAVYGQAAHVLGLFGGPRRMVEAMAKAGVPRDAATIYKWLYPKAAGGTDGLIPTAAWEDVITAAFTAGIKISGEDLMPRRIHPAPGVDPLS